MVNVQWDFGDIKVILSQTKGIRGCCIRNPAIEVPYTYIHMVNNDTIHQRSIKLLPTLSSITSPEGVKLESWFGCLPSQQGEERFKLRNFFSLSTPLSLSQSLHRLSDFVRLSEITVFVLNWVSIFFNADFVLSPFWKNNIIKCRIFVSSLCTCKLLIAWVTGAVGTM